MAKWVYNRPLDCCDETELRVAKLLAVQGHDSRGHDARDGVIVSCNIHRADREGRRG
ncbi:MAG: hypothetical protein KA191_13430 [Verrucomicrobia bacterium]|jgi:hypothetical protein|nr:hypothetical protein [Verrucomicrobiota bacterium]NMD21272.1 hypothetical protein [Verrucomicrobiota bacterium]OQC68143.1 MAG: hypothetical protein BWX48_00188 [Verrucomicrobia bacterium ADurb.Bin006]HOA62552.1 hypothetical protein [Verrucomicrobiota bacterium]